MKKCQYCAQTIQTEAAICPFCKKRIFESSNRKNWNFILAVGLVMFLGGLFLNFVVGIPLYGSLPQVYYRSTNWLWMIGLSVTIIAFLKRPKI